MKTLEDIKRRVTLEVDHYHAQHAGDPWAQGYLYYMETTPEHDGGILAASDAPPNPEFRNLVTPETFRGFTGAQVAQSLFIRGILGRLPVLALE